MTRTPLRLDHVTLRWEDDDRLTDDGDPYLGCTAVAEVSNPCGRDGSRRLEHLTSSGLWGIDPTSTGEYLDEVERDELGDLRDHLAKFGLHLSRVAWAHACLRSGPRASRSRVGAESTCHLAHRYVLELTLKRPIRAGYLALHKCDNPACVNPDHLYEGTPAENFRDMRDRGRWKPIPRQNGTQNGRAKLTTEDVMSIRIEYETVGVSHRSLARKYGVSRAAIRFVLDGQHWGTVK